MTVMEAIEKRKRIRAYLDRPIPPAALEAVLQAGQLAPSARNQQAWKFVVATEPALREQLAEACCGQRFVAQAPAVLVLCADQAAQMRCGQPARTVDCSIALSFMMLEAAEQGLGTCWLGAFEQEGVRRALHIPPEFDIVAVSPLGYPAEEGRPRSRKPLEELVVRERWAD